MRNSRESVYNGLLDLLQEILPSSQVATFSRVYRPVTDYSAAQLPAAVLDEKDEDANVEGLGAAPLYNLHVDLWLYMAAPTLSQIPGQETVVPMTAVNNLLDLLENTPLSNPPNTGMVYQTLGGLVIHTWISGRILKVSGVGSSTMQYSVARVPITIFTT